MGDDLAINSYSLICLFTENENYPWIWLTKCFWYPAWSLMGTALKSRSQTLFSKHLLCGGSIYDGQGGQVEDKSKGMLLLLLGLPTGG